MSFFEKLIRPQKIIAVPTAVEVLQQWVEHLRSENEELKKLLFKKLGLVEVTTNLSSGTGYQPKMQSETWRTAKRKLEDAHVSANPEELSKQQEYWRQKLDEQDKQASQSNK